MVSITRKGYIELYYGDSLLSRHTALEEAFERALVHLAENQDTEGYTGLYRVKYPDREIDVSSILVKAYVRIPSAPRNFVAQATGQTGIALSWDPPEFHAAYVTGYTLEFSSDAGQTWSAVPLYSSGTTAEHVLLTSGTTYQYRVRATQAAGAASPWATTQATTDAETSEGYEFPAGSTTASTATLTAVPTFHNIGLYWSEPAGDVSDECLVRYRPAGGTWRQALSLWWDPRTHQWAGSYGTQYRGSIVKLQPDTTYEIEVLTASSRRIASTTVTTWSETFPVASTVGLPATINSVYTITNGGSAGTGYVVYEPSGASTLIDGENSRYRNIIVDADYVIIRGVTCRGSTSTSVYINPGRHHVVVEECDISEWGSRETSILGRGNDVNSLPNLPSADYPVYSAVRLTTNNRYYQNLAGTWTLMDAAFPGYGRSAQAGIRIGGLDGDATSASSHIVVQNNRIYMPNYSSNSWDTGHPQGPSCCWFDNPTGQIVVRYNLCYGDSNHMYNDVLCGQTNYSWTGGAYGKDSDIYGNRLSHCWDDAVESDGINVNVRIYENFVTDSKEAVSCAQVSQGPVYVFRNVQAGGTSRESWPGGAFWKHRQPTVNNAAAGGRSYLFHNTVREWEGQATRSMFNLDSTSVHEMVSRNNIFNTYNTDYITLLQYDTGTCDFDYDLLSSAANRWSGHQANGIFETTATYDAAHASGDHTLTAGSPGISSGVRLPNFNDDYIGDGPDRGAQERGLPAPVYGIRS